GPGSQASIKGGKQMQRRQVGILIFPEVEVLDFCGPYEVFTAARLDEARRREDPSPFQVWVVAEQEEAIATAAGMRVLPDCALAACPALDILVVPGGWGTRRQLQNETLIDWLAERGRQVISSGTLASVCTGALLLGQAGLLDGRRATTHWRSLQLLRESFPRVTVEERLHVVEDGNLITSAGIAAGLDLALKVVARYYGEGVARATARHMEYRYPQDNARRI
ncbi:MAG: DJ-1/PfpI family protein, partial [Desulfobaccales bacterium]